ncbi:hypothetical protein B0A52_07652 [Exophiala mesophila]|uniref:Serine protease n=1 Tax=Exophiala mesophila TaxID=212818 RepID=A0A438MYE7_EXOME|nr:hypothetical protein B0A52_07652 [Exophiala mesophila]
MENPIDATEITKRDPLPAEGHSKPATVEILNLPLDKKNKPRLEEKDGRLLIVADVGEGGLNVTQPFPNAEAIQVTAEMVAYLADVTEIKSHRPPGVETTFTATKATPTLHVQMARGLTATKAKDEGVDKGGTIFDTDDRILFNPTTYPFRTVGKVRTAGSWGSGTMIGPCHVLTASHCVNWQSDGSIGWLTFTPGYYDGRGPWGEIGVSRVLYWDRMPGSLTDEQTAFDYAVLILEQRIGDTIGHAGVKEYHRDWNGGTYWQYLGYPGELASGQRPAIQYNGIVSTVQSVTKDNREGFVMGHFNEFTPGQSGGCAWGYWANEVGPHIVGVGSTIGSTAVEKPHGSTIGDNEYAGGPALLRLARYARDTYP